MAVMALVLAPYKMSMSLFTVVPLAALTKKALAAVSRDWIS